MRKNVFLPNGNNKSTFQPEGAASAASSLKSSYIKNEEKLSKERWTLNFPFISCVSTSLFASISAANILTDRKVTLSAMNLSKLNINYFLSFFKLPAQPRLCGGLHDPIVIKKLRLHVTPVSSKLQNVFTYPFHHTILHYPNLYITYCTLYLQSN